MKPLRLLFIAVYCLMPSSLARRSIASEPRLTDNDPCYRDDGSATRCIPDFINAAYQRQIVASSTCGDPPVNFCRQHSYNQRRYNNVSESRNNDDDDVRRDCVICDARHPHPASYLTDLNNPHNMT